MTYKAPKALGTKNQSVKSFLERYETCLLVKIEVSRVPESYDSDLTKLRENF